MAAINIPNNWEPRDYQLPLWGFFEDGGRYAAVAWHRRAGKDDVLLNLAATWCAEDPATYWHMLPEYAQARKAIWNAVDPHTGIRRIDQAFPKEIRATTNEQEMFIRFKTGATWQLVGSDSYDKLVGSPPKGVVASEWALGNPSAWAYLRPIIAENGGRAAFISTFRGRNHHFRLVERAKEDPLWFGETLSAYDTNVFSAEDLEREKREYIEEYGREEGEALFRQEFLCDASAAIQGAFYGAEIRAAEEQKRITFLPYDSGYPVFTAWDLGFNDQTAIWFAQQKEGSVSIIDYEWGRNEPLANYAQRIKEKPYNYGGHFLPHDGANKQLATGLSYNEMLTNAGLNNIEVIPRAPDLEAVLTDINTARRLIGVCRFDEDNCERGIDSLRNYRREWDERLKAYKRRPLHDWASDGADGFRTLAVAWDGDRMVTVPRRPKDKRTESTGWMTL